MNEKVSFCRDLQNRDVSLWFLNNKFQVLTWVTFSSQKYGSPSIKQLFVHNVTAHNYMRKHFSFALKLVINFLSVQKKKNCNILYNQFAICQIFFRDLKHVWIFLRHKWERTDSFLEQIIFKMLWILTNILCLGFSKFLQKVT